MGAHLKEGVIFTVARGPVPRERSRTVIFIVARGPVPRELHRPDVYFLSVVCDRLITNGSRAGDLDLQRGGSLVHERWRGTGPRPTVKGKRYFYRSAEACPPRSSRHALFLS